MCFSDSSLTVQQQGIVYVLTALITSWFEAMMTLGGSPTGVMLPPMLE